MNSNAAPAVLIGRTKRDNIMKFQTFGATSPEESKREKTNRCLAREAAAEGIVLLENNGVLPFNPQNIALYGPGSRMTVKGGTGSGDVRERYCVTIEQGLRNAGFTFPNTLWMDRFEKKYTDDIAAWRENIEECISKYNVFQTMQMFQIIGENPMPCPACTPILPDELTDKTDTALYVLSRQAGEGHDRRVEKGDYLLSETEEDSLRRLRMHYKNLILVLNCGGVMDLSPLDEIRPDALLFIGQGGMEGGNAFADIITGAVTPSGKLTDTWARSYADYPCADTFGHRNGNLEKEEYTEGVYVGYRWFDKQKIAPRYPFGYGLSYTQFKRSLLSASSESVTVSVMNTGTFAGKDVVEIFISKPEGDIEHEVRSLAGYVKTKCLAPGESQTLTVPFSLWNIATFDESRSVFVLGRGTYGVLVNDEVLGSFRLDEECLSDTLSLIGSGSGDPVSPQFSPKVTELLKKLSDYDKAQLVVGGGYSVRCYNNVMGAAGRTCTKLLKKGVPNIVFADGPAGLNVLPVTTTTDFGIPKYPEGLPADWSWGWVRKLDPVLRHLPGKGTTRYRYMTAWPSETVQAQTWNTELLEKIGQGVGREMLEIGISVWLAPGLNIHRSPLCGRNFEYYSEDPLIAGKSAAAITRGVQSMSGVSVCQKHFCCNNQEDNRTGVSAEVSQRALREIYLRAFEIAVTEGEPHTVMTSYNRVNGKHVCNTYDLCTRVLRNEWGFDGVVMSDWNATNQCSHYEAINAGNDLIMPGSKDIVRKLMSDLEAGRLHREALNTSAGRVMELIFASETCKDF